MYDSDCEDVDDLVDRINGDGKYAKKLIIPTQSDDNLIILDSDDDEVPDYRRIKRPNSNACDYSLPSWCSSFEDARRSGTIRPNSKYKMFDHMDDVKAFDLLSDLNGNKLGEGKTLQSLVGDEIDGGSLIFPVGSVNWLNYERLEFMQQEWDVMHETRSGPASAHNLRKTSATLQFARLMRKFLQDGGLRMQIYEKFGPQMHDPCDKDGRPKSEEERKKSR